MTKVPFVVNDNTTFSWRDPVVLGNLTINRVVMVMKESDMQSAAPDWQACRASYELANGFLMRWLHLEPEEGFPINTGKNPVNLDETVFLTNKCMVPALESVIMHGQTQCTIMTNH